MPEPVSITLLALVPLLGRQVSDDGEWLRTSAIASPLYLDEEPPELRTLGLIWIPHTEAEGVPSSVDRDFDEALLTAAEIVDEVRSGVEWLERAGRHSAYKNRSSGSVLGSFARGMLTTVLDDFLWSAEIGEVSDPLTLERGVYVAARLETRAACRVIRIRGTGEAEWERAHALAERVRGGEDFAELARAHSDHPGSAERGGAWGLFERGPTDSMIKLETFKARMGELVGPLPLAGSLFLLERIPPSDVPAEVAENNWIRARAVSIGYTGAGPGLNPNPRNVVEAVDLALDLRRRILEGEDMVSLVKRFDDDPTGEARGGDLGWIHRRQPDLAAPLRELFGAQVGELGEPRKFDAGVVLLRREG
jgi:hypothetical protein